MAETVKFYEDNFFGMNTRLDSDKLPIGFSSLAVNVDLTRMKSLRKRQGSRLFANTSYSTAAINGIYSFTSSGRRVQAVIELINTDQTLSQFSIQNSILYKYNKVENRWDAKDRSVFVDGDRSLDIALAYYKNTFYITSETGTLSRYDLSSEVFDEVNNSVEANLIRGKCLAAGQRTLFIGNVVVGGISYPDRVYYSRFDLTTLMEGEEFWEETQTLATSTRFFRVEGGVVRAIVSFPNRDRVYIFSDTKCYEFDVSNAADPFALKEVFPVGCAGPKSVIVISSIMYWMDKDAKVWAWTGGTTRPEEISYNIDDENLGDSVISSIDKSDANLSEITAFGISKQVYFSIGTIRVNGAVLSNACLRFYLSQNGLLSYTSVDTYPTRIVCATTMTIDSANYIVCGTTSHVLVLKDGVNDVSETGEKKAVAMRYRTREYDFSRPMSRKNLRDVFVKYKTQTSDSDLEVSAYVAGNTEPIPISKHDTPKKHGEINMKSKTPFEKQAIKKVTCPTEVQGESIALEFSNSKLNQSVEIKAIGSMNVEISDINITVV